MAKKKPKFNNKHHVDNEKANEILKMTNEQLVNEAASNYRGYNRIEVMKKEDGQILSTNESLVALRDEIKANEAVVDAEESLKSLKEDLISEEQARLEEELTNLRQPYNEDIKTVKNLYKLSMDEINRRLDNGVMVK